MLKQKSFHQECVCYDWPLAKLLDCLRAHDYQSFGQQLGVIANRSEALASKLLQRTYQQLVFMHHQRVDRHHRCAQEFLRGFAQSLRRSVALARDYDDYFLGAHYSRNLAEFVESRQIWQRFDDLLHNIPQAEPLPSSSPTVIDFQRFRRISKPVSI
jgi:hypothetical protein